LLLVDILQGQKEDPQPFLFSESICLSWLILSK
jgi:hypothetical protein